MYQVSKRYFHLLYACTCFRRLSFAIYLLDIAVLIFDVYYGAYLMSILGLTMILACLSFGLITMHKTELVFPWTMPSCKGENLDCTLLLDVKFGWSWYLVLCTGIAVFVCSVIIYIVNFFYPRHVALFFHYSSVSDDGMFMVR